MCVFPQCGTTQQTNAISLPASGGGRVTPRRRLHGYRVTARGDCVAPEPERKNARLLAEPGVHARFIPG